MYTLTLEQLRVTTDNGGVKGVLLKAYGGSFFVEIETRTGSAVLSKARSTQPRGFANPIQAMRVLRELGIACGRFDLTQYDPNQKDMSRSRPDRARAMKAIHAAAHAKLQDKRNTTPKQIQLDLLDE